MTLPDRWKSYSDQVPDWFAGYLALEQQAALIRTYEPRLVPGLLQSPDYARAIIGTVHTDPEDVEQRVELRLARQAALDTDEGFELWAALDEVALTRSFLNAAQARAQVDKLIALTERPEVRIRIVAADHGRAHDESFSIVVPRDRTEPDTVYVEQPSSGRYLNGAAEVAHFGAIMDRLMSPSVTPDITRAALRKIRDGMS